MENGSNNAPPSSLCRSGCGFYGNAAFDGMCSKCYKDALKRKNQNPSPSPVAGRASPACSDSCAAGLSASSMADSTTTAGTSCAVKLPATTSHSIDTATPTVPSTSSAHSSAADLTQLEGASGGDDTASTSDSSESPDKDKKPKKSRCHTCKKKVGLTGFPCRCGGLFCSLHRYSDKHDCTFNYKELAQEQIRKNNPIIVGSKVQKI